MMARNTKKQVMAGEQLEELTSAELTGVSGGFGYGNGYGYGGGYGYGRGYGYGYGRGYNRGYGYGGGYGYGRPCYRPAYSPYF
jgi:hypothetical protein